MCVLTNNKKNFILRDFIQATKFCSSLYFFL